MTHNFGSQISDICVPFLIHHPSSHSYSFLEHHFTLTVLFPSMRNTRSTSIRCTKANDKRGRKGAKWGEHQTSRLFDSDIQKKSKSATLKYLEIQLASIFLKVIHSTEAAWMRTRLLAGVSSRHLIPRSPQSLPSGRECGDLNCGYVGCAKKNRTNGVKEEEVEICLWLLH